MTGSTVHHFVVEPLKGVGPIRFGMHKNEVSRAFTYVYRSFFKVANCSVRADDCEAVGLVIHYDDASLVNFIEVYKARYGTVTLELFGRDITGISVRGLVELLSQRGVEAKKIDNGYDFPALSLSTYNHDLTDDTDDEIIECLGVGLPERD